MVDGSARGSGVADDCVGGSDMVDGPAGGSGVTGGCVGGSDGSAGYRALTTGGLNSNSNGVFFCPFVLSFLRYARKHLHNNMVKECNDIMTVRKKCKGSETNHVASKR